MFKSYITGFSAGGNVTVLSSTRFKERSYQPIDEIDKVSCRPDFSIPVYPGQGGHAFGVRKSGVDSDQWVEAVLSWLHGMGFVRS